MKEKVLSRRYTGKVVAFCFYVTVTYWISPENIEGEHNTCKHIKIKNCRDNDRNFLLVRRWPSTGILKHHSKGIQDKGLQKKKKKDTLVMKSLTETKWLPESQLIKILHNSRKHRPLVWWSHSEKVSLKHVTKYWSHKRITDFTMWKFKTGIQ